MGYIAIMIYILLPVYNEESHIQKLLEDIAEVISGHEYEIIAVDDGSSDRTVEIIESLKLNGMTVLRHNINLSIGAVYATGSNHSLQKARDEDVLILMESDLTSPAEMIKKMYEELVGKELDIVIGSRFEREGGYKKFPLDRMCFSLGANTLMRLFFPLNKIKDYTIFLRAYRVSLLKKVFLFFGPSNCLQTRGFVSNVELLIKCSLFTKKISEIPLVYNYGLKKNRSKMRVLHTIIEYFGLIFYLREIVRKFRYCKRPIVEE